MGNKILLPSLFLDDFRKCVSNVKKFKQRKENGTSVMKITEIFTESIMKIQATGYFGLPEV